MFQVNSLSRHDGICKGPTTHTQILQTCLRPANRETTERDEVHAHATNHGEGDGARKIHTEKAAVAKAHKVVKPKPDKLKSRPARKRERLAKA